MHRSHLATDANNHLRKPRSRKQPVHVVGLDSPEVLLVFPRLIGFDFSIETFISLDEIDLIAPCICDGIALTSQFPEGWIRPLQQSEQPFRIGADELNARTTVPKQVEVLRCCNRSVKPDFRRRPIGVHRVGSNNDQLFVNPRILKLTQYVNHDGRRTANSDSTIDSRNPFILGFQGF